MRNVKLKKGSIALFGLSWSLFFFFLFYLFMTLTFLSALSILFTAYSKVYWISEIEIHFLISSKE